jgi:hypothetical protein
MYAFGDSPNPRPDSCEIVEELVMEFIQELVGAPINHSSFTHSFDSI